MLDDLIGFTFLYPIWLVFFGILAVCVFKFFYIPFFVVLFLISKKWFSIIMFIVYILNAIYFAIFNVLYIYSDNYAGYDSCVMFGVGVLFLSILASLIRIKSFENRRLILVVILLNILISIYPFFWLFGAAMSV